jgi:hypothetical protein
MAAGEFDNLPGLGQRLPLMDEPYDPLWWIRRKLKLEELNASLSAPRDVQRESGLI